MLEVLKNGTLTSVRDFVLGKRHYYRIEADSTTSWIMQVAICIAEDIALSCALDWLDTMRDRLESNFNCPWDQAIEEFVQCYESSGSTQTPRVEMD